VTANSTPDRRIRAFSFRDLFVPLLTHPRAALVIKWTVYLALTVNFIFYFVDDLQVHIATLPDNAPLPDILSTYSTSIDTVAWLGLVYLFELETHALPDEAFSKRVTWFLHATRVACYASIAYAAYGYTIETIENYDVERIEGLHSICQIADRGTYLQINTIDYVEITSANCASLTDEQDFYRVVGETSVVPENVMHDTQWLGWIDVLNAIVWLVVVALIEVEVWLQSRDRYSSRWLSTVRRASTFFYLLLIADAVIWIVNGYVLWAWDAFLWIFGFWAIELNLAEWEMDRVKELAGSPP